MKASEFTAKIQEMQRIHGDDIRVLVNDEQPGMEYCPAIPEENIAEYLNIEGGENVTRDNGVVIRHCIQNLFWMQSRLAMVGSAIGTFYGYESLENDPLLAGVDESCQEIADFVIDTLQALSEL